MTQRTDTQMHKAVVNEFASKLSFSVGKISMAVQNGVATLSGSVPNSRTVQQPNTDAILLTDNTLSAASKQFAATCKPEPSEVI